MINFFPLFFQVFFKKITMLVKKIYGDEIFNLYFEIPLSNEIKNVNKIIVISVFVYWSLVKGVT